VSFILEIDVDLTKPFVKFCLLLTESKVNEKNISAKEYPFVG
jgi:hypothetical protein